MIFTSYFDEADTHGPSPTIIMAGFLGHAYQWERFDKKIRRLQERYGFTIFHAADFKSKSGEFSGWSDEKKCMRLISDLTDLVRNGLTEGLAVSLERERYLSEYRAPPIPKKMNLDSQYGVCFRACLAHLIDRMEERGFRDKMNVVIERGHKNVEDCRRIFNDIKDKYQRIGSNLLGSFTTEGKTDCLPLMLGDFLAASYSMMRTSEPSLSLAETINQMPAANPKEGLLTFLELRPEALKNLKINFEKFRQLEIEEWRRRRDGKKLRPNIT